MLSGSNPGVVIKDNEKYTCDKIGVVGRNFGDPTHTKEIKEKRLCTKRLSRCDDFVTSDIRKGVCEFLYRN